MIPSDSNRHEMSSVLAAKLTPKADTSKLPHTLVRLDMDVSQGEPAPVNDR